MTDPVPESPPEVPGPLALLAWTVSGYFYSWSYGPLAHQLDDDVLSAMGGALAGATVADCGCGPGVVTAKLVAAGAGHVYAIDANSKMLSQVQPDARVTILKATMESLPLDGLRGPEGEPILDLVLFKRSLYMTPDVAVPILKHCYAALRPGGRIVIVHPERSVLRYAFGSPVRLHRHTPYHLFNRTISKLRELAGVESYTVHTGPELLALARAIAPEARVEPVPSAQEAFNIVAIQRPGDAA